MCPIFRRLSLVILGCGVCLLAPGTTAAQQPGEIDFSEGGVPMSRVISDPNPPYENVFRNQSIGGRPLDPKLGPGGRLNINWFPGASAFAGNAVPFIARGFAPGDATLKVGPVYFDLGPATASLLYTDNANRTETNTESGIIGVARLDLRALVQWTEGFRFSIRGAFIYLPFENEAGIDGFGIFDPVMARFDAFGGEIPFSARLTYDFWLSKWDMQFIDDFSAEFLNGFLGFRGEFADELIVTDPVDFEGEDRIGRYSFGSPGVATTSRNGRQTRRLDSGSNLDSDALFLRNLVGLSGRRMIPTQTDMIIAASRQDNIPVGNATGLASHQELASISAYNRRDNMRFKPFASYQVRRLSNRSNVDQTAFAGIAGPVTDQLDFLGSAGWSRAGSSQADNLNWTISFNHIAGAFTSQSVSYYQGITEAEPTTELVETLIYQFRQILGPYLIGDAFYRYRTFRNLDLALGDSREWSVGARLSIDVGPKTDAQLSVVRTQIEDDTPGSADLVFWTGRAHIGYDISPTAVIRLIYSHENRKSSLANDTYAENLVILSLVKSF